MERMECRVCGYVYDPDKGDPSSGIASGTGFERLPDGWKCPICDSPVRHFAPKEGQE